MDFLYKHYARVLAYFGARFGGVAAPEARQPGSPAAMPHVADLMEAATCGRQVRIFRPNENAGEVLNVPDNVFADSTNIFTEIFKGNSLCFGYFVMLQMRDNNLCALMLRRNDAHEFWPGTLCLPSCVSTDEDDTIYETAARALITSLTLDKSNDTVSRAYINAIRKNACIRIYPGTGMYANGRRQVLLRKYGLVVTSIVPAETRPPRTGAANSGTEWVRLDQRTINGFMTAAINQQIEVDVPIILHIVLSVMQNPETEREFMRRLLQTRGTGGAN